MEGLSCMKDMLTVEESVAQNVMIKATAFLLNGGVNQIHIHLKAKIIAKSRHLAHMTGLKQKA